MTRVLIGDPDLHQLLIFILHHCSILIICIKNELPNVLDSYLIQKWLRPVLTFYIVTYSKIVQGVTSSELDRNIRHWEVHFLYK